LRSAILSPSFIAFGDKGLLVVNISERCIASPLARYLQNESPDHRVDIEYNRDANIPKRLGIREARATVWGLTDRHLLFPMSSFTGEAQGD
jgi:hypothetical protein